MTDTALPDIDTADTVELCLTGRLLPGHALETVAPALAQLLGLSHERTLALLAGKETLIKRALPRVQLARYTQLLETLGAEVRVRESVRDSVPEAASTPVVPVAQVAVQAPPAAPAVETVSCPACQCVQPRRTLCRECGVDMPRVRAAQSAPRERGPATVSGARADVPPRIQAPSRSGNGVPLKALGAGVVIVALLAAGWLFMGRLTDERVRAYYDDEVRATLQRDPDALCALMSDDFRGTGAATLQGTAAGAHETTDRQGACAATRSLYASIASMGEAMGGEMHLQYDLDIEQITIAADGKSAQVERSFFLGIGGSVMQFKGKATDTLVRRNGKTLIQRSDSTVSVSAGGQ